MKNQNNDHRKNKIREYIAKAIFIFANIIVFIIFISNIIDYIDSSRHPLTDMVFMGAFASTILIIGTSVFFTAIYLPKKWISAVLGILEIIILISIIILVIIDDGYYSVEAHIRRILYAFLAGYVIIFLEYHFFRFLLNAIFSKQSLKTNEIESMDISETDNSNIQQPWRDRFLQKIFRGISTFSFIPLVATIIAPMITFFLPVAYSIYYILKIPSTDVMLGIINLPYDSLLILILNTFLVELYFITVSLLLLSIVTMAKEKKKGNLGLIQHGIYAKIRHPQNLGISLVLFSVFFIFDTLIYSELVIGHIISWGVFTLFLQLESLIEEKKLVKQFPDQYWAYIHNTGFFHFRFKKQKPIHPKLPGLESKYFRRRIILSVTVFILLYLSIFTFVIVLKNYNYDFLRFSNPLNSGGGFYPDTHIINEIVVTLVPIGIWLVSFIITLVHYLKEKRNKNKGVLNETEKEQSLIQNRLRVILFWVFIFFLILYGLLIITVFMNDLNYPSR